MSPDAPNVDITSHDTYVDGVPHEVFARMRATEPVAWTEEADGGRGFWSLTKYDDVLYASRHTELFSSRLGIRMEDMDAEETEARRTMMEMDSPGTHAPPAHRGATVHARAPSRTTRAPCENSPRKCCHNLHGSEEFDFVKDVARELPMKMLGRLLGLPNEDLDWLVSRGDALIGNSDPDFTDYVVDQSDTSAYRLLPFRSPVAIELFEYAQQALEERRLTPTHDVLTALLAPTKDGDTLDDPTLKNFFTLMVAAGNDTTRYTMTAGTQVFIERPEIFAALPDDGRGPDEAPRRRGPALGEHDHALSSHRRRRHRTARSETRQGRQGRPLVHLGELRRRAVRRPLRLHQGPRAERPRRLRTPQRAPLPRRAPRATRIARDVRRDGQGLVEYRSGRPQRTIPIELHQRDEEAPGSRDLALEEREILAHLPVGRRAGVTLPLGCA